MYFRCKANITTGSVATAFHINHRLRAKPIWTAFHRLNLRVFLTFLDMNTSQFTYNLKKIKRIPLLFFKFIFLSAMRRSLIFNIKTFAFGFFRSRES